MNKLLFLLLQLPWLVGLALPSCNAQPENLSRLESRLDSLINTTMEAEHIPGAAFIVVKDGKTLLKKGYGYTSLGDDIRRVDPDSTIFRIGSITKTFTATALLQLVDQKKIDLASDVNTYLTSLQVPKGNFNKPITAAHLLNHSAGFDELRGRVEYQQNQSIPLAQYLENRLIRLREPGLVSSYSSFGIALAGLLVEDQSKMSLEGYLKKYIWDPLGMDMTSMFLNNQVEQYASWGYEYRNGVNLPQPWEYYHTYPASEINSTVNDMGKYMQMHLNNGILNDTRILSESLAKQMKTPILRVAEEVEAFGFGFYEDDNQGFRTISHGGEMLGFSSYIALVPEENLGVFVIHHHEGTRLRHQVTNMVLEHFAMQPQQQAVIPIKQSTDLRRFAGEYMWSTYCHSCETGWKPNRHALVLNNDGTFTILGRTYVQTAPLVFKSTDGERVMGFVEDATGKITYMSLGGVNLFEKIN